MARNRFRGDAPNVAQISQFTVTGAGAAADTVIVTINRKTVTAIVPATPTTTTVAAAVAAACAASSIAEFKNAIWTSDGAVVYATAATPGRPFTITSVTVTGTVTVGAVSTPTASSGQWHWDTAANWTLNAVPVSTDDVDFIDGSTDVLYGIDQNGVTLNSLNIYSTYTGKIGNLFQNPEGYVEYRETYLKISATTVNIGVGQGAGSSLIKLNVGSVQTAVVVSGTGSPASQGTPVLYFLGTHASNVVTVNNGSVGLAYELGTSATVLTLNVGAGTGTPPLVYAGIGLTLGTVNSTGGELYSLVGCTTINQDIGSSITFYGAATCNVTTVNGRGGTIVFNAPTTIGALVLSGTFADFSQDPRAKTVTTCTANAGSTVNDPDKRVTFTAAISCPDGVNGPGFSGGCTLNLGKQISIQRS